MIYKAFAQGWVHSVVVFGSTEKEDMLGKLVVFAHGVQIVTYWFLLHTNDKETAESVLRSGFSPRDEQDHGACTFATWLGTHELGLRIRHSH